MEVSHLAESELGRVWLLTHLSDFVFHFQAVVSLATIIMQVFVFVGKESLQFHGSYEFFFSQSHVTKTVAQSDATLQYACSKTYYLNPWIE